MSKDKSIQEKDFVVRVVGLAPAYVEYMVKAASAEDAHKMVIESSPNLRQIAPIRLSGPGGKVSRVTDVVVRNRFTGSIELARKM